MAHGNTPSEDTILASGNERLQGADKGAEAQEMRNRLVALLGGNESMTEKSETAKPTPESLDGLNFAELQAMQNEINRIRSSTVHRGKDGFEIMNGNAVGVSFREDGRLLIVGRAFATSASRGSPLENAMQQIIQKAEMMEINVSKLDPAARKAAALQGIEKILSEAGVRII